ncbi:MAG TPA: DUF4012 domain-containing protein [Acidimicrobiales bacterium]|nr:DUF4012 domain-containing protein [Acidimicrobiales bacterium]
MEADQGKIAALAPVSLLVVAAATGGALAGCHPTGTPVLDPIYTAVFAAAVTWAAARAPRGTLLWLGVLAVVMSRGWLVVPALAALLLAFAGVLPRRPNAILGALTGALAVQIVLRWPPMGFHGATALVAVVATAPCLVEAVRTLSAPTRRRVRRWTFGLMALAIVVSIPVGVAALLAHSEISQGIDQAEGALGSIGNGTTAYGAAQLQEASADFGSAASSTDSWWTAAARLVPVVSQQRQAMGQASAVARDVTATAAAKAAGINYQQLRYSDGQLDLNRVSALARPIDDVDDQLTGAVAQLRSLQSGWLLEPVQSRLSQLDTKVFRAQASASLAAQLVQAAPSLLGGDGVRHYFIAFMTPAESRGLDGLIASYGELTADQGHLTLTVSGDIGTLNRALPKAGGHLTGPADYLARYGAFQPQKLFQDLSYAPDLPTVADVIKQLYPQAGGGPIDGVLALDPYGLAALIHLTGPIKVPGLGKLTAANTANELLQGQYSAFSESQQGAAHDYDQDALRIEFHKLTTGSLPGPRALSDALEPEVRQGRIAFWSFDKADQPVLFRLGLTGSFPAARGHDLLAVTTQNAANNKIDVYLQRSISDAVSYDPANGAVASKVSITLHNSAPAQGLPNEVIGSYPGSGLPPGTNETWLTLYSPLGLRAATVNGQVQGVKGMAELGVHAYSDYVEIPPEGSVTLTFDLAGVTTPGLAYRLSLYNQPMVLPDADTVTVQPTPGWTVTGPGTWPDDLTDGLTFRFRGDR